jgi:hypothetical protein
MGKKRHMLIFIFKSMLVDRKEWGSYEIEVVIRKGERYLLWKLIGKKVVVK